MDLKIDDNFNIIRNGKILKQYRDKDGYAVVSYTENNITINHKVHRLIAKTFIPNPESKPNVNHKNGIKNDNRIENLEWATQSENLKHSYDNLGRVSPAKGMKGKLNWSSKGVLQISLDGFIINEFDSATQASDVTGIKRQSICKARCGSRNKAGGYVWL